MIYFLIKNSILFNVFQIHFEDIDLKYFRRKFLRNFFWHMFDRKILISVNTILLFIKLQSAVDHFSNNYWLIIWT